VDDGVSGTTFDRPQESKKELLAKWRELEKGKRRALELNGVFKKLYEDRGSDRRTV